MARYRRRGNYSRSQRRKFIWVRKFGQLAVGSGTVNGVDLLEDFRNTPGATHLGATVMRVRGYTIPLAPGSSGARLGGTIGLRIDSTSMDPTLPANAPTGVAEEDWMAWLPYLRDTSIDVSSSWNSYANQWAVDVKSNRRVEELDQTLWMLSSPAGSDDISYQYNLSIGLKLA